MHILLVEDNRDIGEDLQAYLIACGFSCDRVMTVGDAKATLTEHIYDVAVLDRMLPDGSGEELCRWIKSEYGIPVILQTAKFQIEDKLQAFDGGADDYLTKPYDLRELEARIKRVESWKGKIESNIFSLGALQFHMEAMQIFHDGAEIHCTAHEWIVLKLLLENPGEVIARATIVDYVRGSEGMWQAENKVDVLISGIRKKLGKEVIETVKGYGYRIQVIRSK